MFPREKAEKDGADLAVQVLTDAVHPSSLPACALDFDEQVGEFPLTFGLILAGLRFG
jgi:hypothetical protein